LWDWSIDAEELKDDIYVIILGEVNIKSTNVGEIAISRPVRVEFKKVDNINVSSDDTLGVSTNIGYRSRVYSKGNSGINISSHTDS